MRPKGAPFGEASRFAARSADGDDICRRSETPYDEFCLVARVRVSDTCACAYQIIFATGFPSGPYTVGISIFVAPPMPFRAFAP